MGYKERGCPKSIYTKTRRKTKAFFIDEDQRNVTKQQHAIIIEPSLESAFDGCDILVANRPIRPYALKGFINVPGTVNVRRHFIDMGTQDAYLTYRISRPSFTS